MRIRTVIALMMIILLSLPTSAKDEDRWAVEPNTSQGSLRLLKVERLLTEDSTKAISMLKDIPEAVFKERGFFKIHNHNCIANAYYYKTMGQLEDRNLDEAQRFFLYFVDHCMLAHQQQSYSNYKPDSLSSQKLRFLQSIFLADASDDSTIMALKQQLTCFKQNITPLFVSLKTLSTEYQLLHHSLYWPLLFLVTFAALSVALYQRKEIEAHKMLANHIKQEELLRAQIAHLELQSNSNSSKLEKMHRQLAQLQKVNMLRIGKGKQYYDLVKAGGTMKNISVDDEQCFIDYYTYTFPHEYHKLTTAYSSLTLRHTTFLILSEMGFSDKDICRILFVKDSTIRNYRLRINRKKN